MKRILNVCTTWGVTGKLVALFLIFGLIPMAAIGMIAYKAGKDIEENVGKKFEATAITIADTIDRKLADRYWDVQAFARNYIVEERHLWYSPEENKLTQTMNDYVATYGIYYLTLFVDLEGALIAVNSKDAQGNAINTQPLFKKNFKDTKWFQALKANAYTTKMPFTAPGNDISTGTFIEDLHIDQDVKQAFQNDDGLTIGFSAPVYQDGNIIGYWSNRVQYSLVEKIFQEEYTKLKVAGYPGAEMTLLNSIGQIIVDYDPVKNKTEGVVHNLDNVILKLNLAEKGVAVAQNAIAGKTGFSNALHARKQIIQAGGYTHLRGASGYPGMNWAVLVRIPQSEAAVEANAIQQNVFLAILVCLGLSIVLGAFIGKRAAKNILRMSEVIQQAADGDLTKRVSVRSQDELGTMGEALNRMLEKTKEVVSNVRKSADHVASTSTQISEGNQNLSQRTAEQASSLEETSSSMEQMTSTVKQNADSAKQASQLAETARNVAGKGSEITSQAVSSMDEINKSSKKIADIINVIDEIAFQTNLLALNAAVEAARAGEQGRGFAVVASEVRNLAQRSAGSAKEIKDLINESVQKVTEGSKFVNESGRTLGEIVESVKRVADIITEITMASQEQAQGISQVNEAILQMDTTTQQNAALVEQSAAASEGMLDQAQNLKQLVQFFHVDDKTSHSMAKHYTHNSGGSEIVNSTQSVHIEKRLKSSGQTNGPENPSGEPSPAFSGEKSHLASHDTFEEF